MGCDEKLTLEQFNTRGFNPRTHMGCDEIARQITQEIYVSIHAPTWGATMRVRDIDFVISEFQSTHPHGVRHVIKMLCCKSNKFQSTHPHGVRLFKIVEFAQPVLFQSTHPHGVRLFLINAFNFTVKVSIHAPTWGATPCCRGGREPYPSFNPRTHMGCDINTNMTYESFDVSIHAPTWGATRLLNILPLAM